MKKTDPKATTAKKRSHATDITRRGEAVRQAAEVQALASAMPHNAIKNKEFGQIGRASCRERVCLAV